MTNISNLNAYVSLYAQDPGMKRDLPRLPEISDATRTIYQESSHGNLVIPDLRAAFEEMSNCHAQYSQQRKAYSRERLGDFSIISGLAAGVAMAVNSLFKAVVFGLSTPVALSLAIPLGITCGIVYLVKVRTASCPTDHFVTDARAKASTAIKNFVEALKDSAHINRTIESKVKGLSESDKKIYTKAIEEIRAAYGYTL